MSNRTFGIWLAAFFFAASAFGQEPLTPIKARALVKRYLEEDDAGQKAELLKEAGETPADEPRVFVKALQPSRYPPARPGTFHGMKLPVPAEVSDKPIEYSISIPNGYSPRRAWPLVIGLHGGGATIGFGKDAIRTFEAVTRMPVVVACPDTADRGIKHFWRSPKNEIMLPLFIRYLSQQVSIDHDRVYLVGYSMGGIGIYYLGPRLSQHFAAIAPGGGAWQGCHWPSLLNTPIYIWHGKRDNRGKQFTNFDYAKHAASLLQELGDEYRWYFRAMDCDHANVPPAEIPAMIKWLSQFKRNAYPQRIVLSSPRATEFGGLKPPALPDRWLAIDEIGPKKLTMTALEHGGANRKDLELPMGVLDAAWTEPGKLEVKAENVKQFRVLLAPQLVKFGEPLEIKVNGEIVHQKPAHSSLKFLMEYVDKYRDPGMVYSGEVVVDMKSAD